MTRSILSVAFVAMMVVTTARAADDPAKPAAPAAPGAAADNKIQIVEIKGTADFRTAPDQAWQALKNDSPLTVGCELRTGLRSSVKLKMGANSEVEVKSLTTVAIADLTVNEQDKTIRTRLGKKYGTMKASVHQVGDLSNDYQISTPSSVLAIRGSGGQHTEFGPTWNVEWYEGHLTHFFESHSFLLTPGDGTNQNNPNPNTPPGRVLLVLGQDPQDIDQPGQGLIDLLNGFNSINSSIDAAHHAKIDHGGEDDGGGPGK